MTLVCMGVWLSVRRVEWSRSSEESSSDGVKQRLRRHRKSAYGGMRGCGCGCGTPLEAVVNYLVALLRQWLFFLHTSTE